MLEKTVGRAAYEGLYDQIEQVLQLGDEEQEKTARLDDADVDIVIAHQTRTSLADPWAVKENQLSVAVEKPDNFDQVVTVRANLLQDTVSYTYRDVPAFERLIDDDTESGSTFLRPSWLGEALWSGSQLEIDLSPADIVTDNGDHFDMRYGGSIDATEMGRLLIEGAQELVVPELYETRTLHEFIYNTPDCFCLVQDQTRCYDWEEIPYDEMLYLCYLSPTVEFSISQWIKRGDDGADEDGYFLFYGLRHSKPQTNVGLVADQEPRIGRRRQFSEQYLKMSRASSTPEAYSLSRPTETKARALSQELAAFMTRLATRSN